MKNKIYYLLKEEFQIAKIHTLLPVEYKGIRIDSVNITERLYDTFDWSLFKNNILFTQFDNEYYFNSLLNDITFYSFNKTAKKDYVFYCDFPVSSFNKTLKNIIDVRALLPQLSYSKHIVKYKILNKEEKTVVNIQFITIKLMDNNISKRFYFLQLNPVRGYYNIKHEITVLLKNLITEVLNKKQVYQMFLSALDIIPEQFSSKYNLSLNPDSKTHLAIKKILKYLLRMVKKNKEGIIKDIDTEFLHDFRVAIRRTRTVLMQIKNVFPQKEVDRLTSELRSITIKTNRLRDIDVYLLNQNYYQKLIPLYLRKNLKLLFNDLKRERKMEQASVANWLNEAEYENIINYWEEFYRSKPNIKEESGLINRHLPVKTIANKFIVKKYKSVIKLGCSITKNTPDEQLHTLRIECKKLRYLLEFFSTLFETEKILFFIKQLKKLQDNLGRFNDLHMQQLDLQNYVDKKIKSNINTSNTFVAIGALINALNKEQADQRKGFIKIFIEFTNKENKKLFKQLFSNSEQSIDEKKPENNELL